MATHQQLARTNQRPTLPAATATALQPRSHAQSTPETTAQPARTHDFANIAIAAGRPDPLAPAPPMQTIRPTPLPGNLPAPVRQELNTPGLPIDAQVRARMAQSLGLTGPDPLSSVRVHTSSDAAASAHSVHAQAYTTGHHIVFGAGHYAPGTAAGSRLLAHELSHVVQQARGSSVGSGTAPAESLHEHQANAMANATLRGGPIPALTPAPISIQRQTEPPGPPPPPALKVAFVFQVDPKLKLREGPSTDTPILAELAFGKRLNLLDDPNAPPGWQRVAVDGRVGYVARLYLREPTPERLKQDPGIRMIQVKAGQSFWELVKAVYGIQGNESTPDKNINHYINAIRAYNTKADTFITKTDTLDDIGNWIIPGRDASDTLLKADMRLWIPSFAVASKMDVGSGTVTGELSRLAQKVMQRIKDFEAASLLALSYTPGAVRTRAGEMAAGLIDGLIKFALDAAKILAASTAVGALLGALAGGVGAIPGAEIGFEAGLLILEAYGLYEMIEAILGMTGQLVTRLGTFIELVWNALGDKAKIEEAAKTLADALGILVTAVLTALTAYVMKKGISALGKTRFGKTIGESELSRWVQARKRGETTAGLRRQIGPPAPATVPSANRQFGPPAPEPKQPPRRRAESAVEEPTPAAKPSESSASKATHVPDEIDLSFEETFQGGKGEGVHPAPPRHARGLVGEKLATEALAAKGHKILDYKPDISGTTKGGIDSVTFKDGKLYAVDNKALSKGGNISSVSALTTNYKKNIAAVRKQFADRLKEPGLHPEQKIMFQRAIDAIDSGQVVKAVTNANIVGRKSIKVTGVTEKLKEQGIVFIDVMQ